MKEIDQLYNTPQVGLKDAAREVSKGALRFTTPRYKITVLIVGHHAAAKQRFLDLYFKDTRQHTKSSPAFISKVNYDKLDKIYITHGYQHRLLVGESVLDYCPHLAQLKDVPGLKDYLTTEISARNTKSLVSFILAPEGLASDPHDYPSSSSLNGVVAKPRQSSIPREALAKLAEASDLIFLFFDPTGTKSPKETLMPFEPLWDAYHEKILFIVATANEHECTEETREEVLGQMVREIWRNSTVRRVGYLPEIYCPDLSAGIRDDQRLWNVIQNTAEDSVDRALVRMGQDAASLRQRLETQWKQNQKAKHQFKECSQFFYWFLAILIGAFVWYMISAYENVCSGQNSSDGGFMGFRKMYGAQLCQKEGVITHRFLVMCFCAVCLLCIAYMCLSSQQNEMLSEDEEKLLEKRIGFVTEALQRKEVMESLHVGMTLT